MDAKKPAHAATLAVGGMEVYVALEGLVDFAAERERIAKELESTRKELDKFERKLSNEGFLAKAKPEIIEKDRAKATALAETVSALESQASELQE